MSRNQAPSSSAYRAGRHFLQVPGPTNVPDRVLRAMSKPTIDHRGPDFALMTLEILGRLRGVFRTEGPMVMYPASGTGAWEAALVNTLSPGDHILMFETGQFATLWSQQAKRLGISVEFVAGDWRNGVDANFVEQTLKKDPTHRIKAVCVVHNETSTGVTSSVPSVRQAIDAAKHPALLMVDAISSLGSIDYRHDEWRVDVTVACSQKGLMLPPGLSFNAISERALAAHKQATMPRSYWEWDAMIEANRSGFFPYTPPTNLLFGLNEALAMLEDEGMSNVFARHTRHAEATRAAVRAWELDIVARNPAEYSSVLTAVMMPDGHDADRLRATILDSFDVSLGTGLGKLARKIFRIGHLGHFNDVSLLGTLSGVEMGLGLNQVPHAEGGVRAAMTSLMHTTSSNDARSRAGQSQPGR